MGSGKKSRAATARLAIGPGRHPRRHFRRRHRRDRALLQPRKCTRGQSPARRSQCPPARGRGGPRYPPRSRPGTGRRPGQRSWRDVPQRRPSRRRRHRLRRPGRARPRPAGTPAPAPASRPRTARRRTSALCRPGATLPPGGSAPAWVLGQAVAAREQGRQPARTTADRAQHVPSQLPGERPAGRGPEDRAPGQRALHRHDQGNPALGPCKWGIDQNIVFAQAAVGVLVAADHQGRFRLRPSACPPGHRTLNSQGQCAQSYGILRNRYPFEKASSRPRSDAPPR